MGASSPRLGKRRVSDIGKSDVVALHHDMRDVPGHANRTLGVLSRMLTLAEVWEMRPEGVNPCRHVKKYPEHKRERFLSDDEYRRLGAALRDAEREGFASQAAIAAIRLLMLTGCRSGEIMSLRWDYVDLDMGELRLQDSKTGAKVVHLGDPAIAVLRGIPRKEGNPWVLPGLKHGRHIAYLHDLVASHSRPRRDREPAHPRSQAFFRQWGPARRRGVADDREAAWPQQGADHCALRPSGQRSAQGSRQPHRQPDCRYSGIASRITS